MFLALFVAMAFGHPGPHQPLGTERPADLPPEFGRSLLQDLTSLPIIQVEPNLYELLGPMGPVGMRALVELRGARSYDVAERGDRLDILQFDDPAMVRALVAARRERALADAHTSRTDPFLEERDPFRRKQVGSVRWRLAFRIKVTELTPTHPEVNEVLRLKAVFRKGQQPVYETWFATDHLVFVLLNQTTKASSRRFEAAIAEQLD